MRTRDPPRRCSRATFGFDQPTQPVGCAGQRRVDFRPVQAGRPSAQDCPDTCRADVFIQKRYELTSGLHIRPGNAWRFAAILLDISKGQRASIRLSADLGPIAVDNEYTKGPRHVPLRAL